MCCYKAIVYDGEREVPCGYFLDEAFAFFVMEKAFARLKKMLGEEIWGKLEAYAARMQPVFLDGGVGFTVRMVTR